MGLEEKERNKKSSEGTEGSESSLHDFVCWWIHVFEQNPQNTKCPEGIQCALWALAGSGVW